MGVSVMGACVMELKSEPYEKNHMEVQILADFNWHRKNADVIKKDYQHMDGLRTVNFNPNE